MQRHKARSESRDRRGSEPGGEHAERTTRVAQAPSNDALQRYVSEVQGHELLSGAEELKLAQEIEERELAHWQALLSYPAALALVLDKCRRELPETPAALSALRKLVPAAHAHQAPTARSETRWERAATAAAEALRTLDAERAALRALDVAVSEAYGTVRGARRYLARVDAARKHEQQAKHRFVSANLRLVMLLARRFDRGLMPMSDLIQEGNLGLMRAVERFDYRRGFRFSTYASWWIRHALSRAVADKARLVRVPVHTLDDAQRLARASDASAAQRGDAPTLEELRAQTGLSAKKLSFLRDYALARGTVSLDAKVGADGEGSLLEILALPTDSTPEDAYDAAEWSAQLEPLLSKLSGLEASILRFRFGLDGHEELTLNEIGIQYNLSRERIRQLQEQALRKLRTELERGRSTLASTAA